MIEPTKWYDKWCSYEAADVAAVAALSADDRKRLECWPADITRAVERVIEAHGKHTGERRGATEYASGLEERAGYGTHAWFLTTVLWHPIEKAAA